MLCDYVQSQNDQSEPVTRLLSLSSLKCHFREAGIPLELAREQRPADSQALLAAVSATLRFSVRTGHPYFLNNLYSQADPVGVAADWLTTAANANVFTFEVAPVFTAVEVEVLSKLARCVGGPYEDSHDGLFVPGGSISNIYGMLAHFQAVLDQAGLSGLAVPIQSFCWADAGLHLARNRLDPDYRRRGAFGGPHMVAFTSEHAHFSYLKGAFLTGTARSYCLACIASPRNLLQDFAQVTSAASVKIDWLPGVQALAQTIWSACHVMILAKCCQMHWKLP